jgi:hypothetical protein
MKTLTSIRKNVNLRLFAKSYRALEAGFFRYAYFTKTPTIEDSSTAFVSLMRLLA